MNAAGYANIAGGLTNGQNWTNLGNNLTGSVNQFGTGISQSVNQIGTAGRQIGSALNRRPAGTATTASNEATKTGSNTAPAAAPTPAPPPSVRGPI
jgi:hypothetical protein